MSRQTYSYPEYNKKWRQDHPEYFREYCQAHAERIKEYKREYSQAHLMQRREYDKEYRQAHVEHLKEYRQAHPEVVYANYVRRRMREENSIIEEVDPHYIYKRDGWVCQICGKKVNPKLKYPDPMSASLDHIIPLSKGGTHERKNLQLAHRICNLKKHNGGHDQLRLIG